MHRAVIGEGVALGRALWGEGGRVGRGLGRGNCMIKES